MANLIKIREALDAICAEGRTLREGGPDPADLQDLSDGLTAAVNTAAEAVGDLQEAYLIWSNEHQLWWRPGSAGYTSNVEEAGRYPRDEALDIASGARDGWRYGEAPPEIAIAESDVLAHRRQPARRAPEMRRAAR